MRVRAKVVEAIAIGHQRSADHHIHRRTGISDGADPISPCALNQRRLQRQVKRCAGVVRRDQNIAVAVRRVVEAESSAADRHPVERARGVNYVQVVFEAAFNQA